MPKSKSHWILEFSFVADQDVKKRRDVDVSRCVGLSQPTPTVVDRTVVLDAEASLYLDVNLTLGAIVQYLPHSLLDTVRSTGRRAGRPRTPRTESTVGVRSSG